MPEAPLARDAPAEDAAARAPARTALVAYVLSLWRGERPLAQVFWFDMLAIGTLANVVATIVALILFVSGAPVVLGVIVHFLPLPYNILLFLAVWQSAAREASEWSFPAQGLALVWLIATFVV